LYSLPAVAVKVLELTANPQVDTHALKEAIENDPALTAKLLRVVNSSLFGLSREVSDLNQALALLGTKPLKLLVLGFSLPSGLLANVAGEILGRYWQHTLTKAVAAREISETVFNTPGDDAFIAGLLQDLGELLLVQELGRPYLEFIEKVAAGGKDLLALEAESMGFDHTALSARLMAQWGLPETLVGAVDRQAISHEPSAVHGNQLELPQVLYLAELLAQLLVGERSGVLADLLEAGRRYANLSEAQLETLVGNLEAKVPQLAEVLSLELPDGLDYRDVLVRAHVQLAEVAADAAGEMLCGGEKVTAGNEDENLLNELRALGDVLAQVSRRSAEDVIPAEPADPDTAAAPGSPATIAAVDLHDSADDPLAHFTPVAATATATSPRLLSRLAVAVAACHHSRCALSMLLAELDHTDDLLRALGMENYGKLKRFLKTACENLDHRCAICMGYGEAGFALILPDCERSAAVRLGNDLIRRAGEAGPVGNHRVSISVGVAAVAPPPKNFRGEDLLGKAERCLYGSHVSGGGVVKSIEIY